MASEGKDLDFPQVLKQSFDPASGGLKANVMNNLIPAPYDAIELTYSGDDITQVIYKKDGNTVAALDLTYTSGKLTLVERS